MSKHFTTEGTETFEAEDGTRYISGRDAVRILGEESSNLRRQAINAGVRDGEKYTMTDIEFGAHRIWYDAEYIERVCALRNKAQRKVIDLDTFLDMIKSDDTSEFADTYATLGDLTRPIHIAPAVYSVMDKHKETGDQIVPEYPHDLNSEDVMTVQQYIDSLYSPETKRESVSALTLLLYRQANSRLPAHEIIKFVAVDSLVAVNKSVRRDLSSLLSKIESGEIRTVENEHFGPFIRVTDFYREVVDQGR